MSGKFGFSTCKEVTHLVLQGEDRQLGVTERLKVRLHLMICKACPIFAEQVALMRQASQRWRRYSETSEASDTEPTPRS
jgi:hypothetical protein